MVTFLRFRTGYAAYLRHEHGIKKFAEMSMGQLIRKVTKKSAAYREMNENLLVEKANLRIRRDERYEQTTLEVDSFFSVRHRLWANAVLVSVILAAAVFLNVLSIETFIEGTSASETMFRWVVAVLMAVVLTGGGMITTERLLGELIPPASPGGESPAPVHAALWGLLLLGVETAILGLAEAYASVVAGSPLGYLAFLIVSMILPLIAGAFRWDSSRFIDRYKATLALRQIESRLAQIDSIMRQNEEYESNFYRIKSIEYWDLVNDFKTYKDNLNRKRGIVEQLGGHFAQSYDLFQAEANKRYTQDIRDVTAQSLRKLALVEPGAAAGEKIGQFLGAGRATGPVAPPSGRPAVGYPAEEYLPLKPIR